VKPVVGFEERYSIDEYGNVFSIAKNRFVGFKNRKKRGGYRYVSLWNGHKHVNKQCHRLVYEAFVGVIEDGLCIDHIDGNSKNNHYTNLRKVSNWANHLYGKKKNGREHPCIRITKSGKYGLGMKNVMLGAYDTLEDAEWTRDELYKRVSSGEDFDKVVSEIRWLRSCKIVKVRGITKTSYGAFKVMLKGKYLGVRKTLEEAIELLKGDTINE